MPAYTQRYRWAKTLNRRKTLGVDSSPRPSQTRTLRAAPYMSPIISTWWFRSLVLRSLLPWSMQMASIQRVRCEDGFRRWRRAHKQIKYESIKALGTKASAKSRWRCGRVALMRSIALSYNFNDAWFNISETLEFSFGPFPPANIVGRAAGFEIDQARRIFKHPNPRKRGHVVPF